MLTIHAAAETGLNPIPDAGALTSLPDNAVWIDLMIPPPKRKR